MAKDLDKKNEFIILRAEGKSYSFITGKLEISKTTCIKWNRELEEKILEQKQDNLNRLYSAYNITKEARIKKLGTTLNKIDKALASVDFSTIAPEKLLDFKLKYTQALKEEYIPANTTCREIQASENYIGELEYLLQRVRSEDIFNGISTNQLNNEMKILKELNTANMEAGKINDSNEVIRIVIDDKENEKEIL